LDGGLKIMEGDGEIESLTAKQKWKGTIRVGAQTVKRERKGPGGDAKRMEGTIFKHPKKFP